jgi:hypothetical protein
MGALLDLPDLRPQPELGATLTVRLTRSDRHRIDALARELGVPPGRLARAILRHALEQAGSPTDC